MSESSLLNETLPNLKSTNPINKFTSDQIALVIGEDNPLPGGLAKGVGKDSPVTPLT